MGANIAKSLSLASRDLLSAIPIILLTAHFERVRANSSQVYVARLKLGIEVTFCVPWHGSFQ